LLIVATRQFLKIDTLALP